MPIFVCGRTAMFFRGSNKCVGIPDFVVQYAFPDYIANLQHFRAGWTPLTYVHMYISHTYTHTHIRVDTPNVRTHVQCTYIRTHTHIQVDTPNVRTHVQCTYMRTHTHIRVDTPNVRTHVQCTYIHTHTHIHMQTYIHACMLAHVQVQAPYTHRPGLSYPLPSLYLFVLTFYA